MLAQRPPLDADDEASWDQKEMPFTEHLRELRNRLLIAIATVGVIAVVLFWPSQFAIRWMMREYFGSIQLHAFGPADVIFTEFKFSIVGGIIIGLPVLLQQLWLFVVPAIHPRTRRMVYYFIAPSILLALAGIAFAHFVVIPRVIAALLHITNAVATPTFGVSATLNFVIILFALFAIIFQTPVVLVGLARLGIVSRASLAHYRRHAFFGFFVAGGIAAPDGNPMTMALLALPMYALYELSIWIIAPLERRWAAAPAR
ncbi:MAG: twin-arginine translocase subunit TatC [Candidatus Eremiobacteraeota bacterium]|nr:twin-arginine translocase subunit TatC [Candidatus Eremiobacteraeota bacterium]MBV9055307.1 twin-arginine translocase subunit TatC [Candidatus Eremiobacteraeota bacterium]MBV9699829.1 twin-arginine translocase subunit TatC [Candidatus Eremiobacteraeota bacterium]